MNDGHHDLHERALTGPVGPEQTEDLAARHAHLNPAQRVDFALVDFGHLVKVNRQFGHAVISP
jgi:hypothetical protein